MDSYRVEKRAVQKILLPDEGDEIEPVPTRGGDHVAEPELDRLSNIFKTTPTLALLPRSPPSTASSSQNGVDR